MEPSQFNNLEFSNKITISHELHVGKSEGWSRSSTLFVFECRGRLGEYTIRLGYAPFLIAIAFMRVGCVLGPTSGIRAEVTSSNPRGVIRGKLLADQRVGRVHQLPLCSNVVGAWVNAL